MACLSYICAAFSSDKILPKYRRIGPLTIITYNARERWKEKNTLPAICRRSSPPRGTLTPECAFKVTGRFVAPWAPACWSSRSSGANPWSSACANAPIRGPYRRCACYSSRTLFCYFQLFISCSRNLLDLSHVSSPQWWAPVATLWSCFTLSRVFNSVLLLLGLWLQSPSHSPVCTVLCLVLTRVQPRYISRRPGQKAPCKTIPFLLFPSFYQLACIYYNWILTKVTLLPIINHSWG